MERLGSCARTRNLARNARRFALVPRGKQGGESVMQARCKPVAWAELRRSYSVAFVFTSCSLRILFVFSSYSLGVLHCFSRGGSPVTPLAPLRLCLLPSRLDRFLILHLPAGAGCD